MNNENTHKNCFVQKEAIKDFEKRIEKKRESIQENGWSLFLFQLSGTFMVLKKIEICLNILKFQNLSIKESPMTMKFIYLLKLYVVELN